MEKRLYVGFKGKNNASSVLVQALTTEGVLLTNSFRGIKKDVDNIKGQFEEIYMFGIDKNLHDKVRIELSAESDGIKRYTDIDAGSIVCLLREVGITSQTSDNPTHYLCNEAYWHALRRFAGKAIFIHIPSNRNMSQGFIEKIQRALAKMTDEVFKLYKSTLPNIVRSEETVKGILENENSYIIDYKTDGKLVGVSVINENCIYLLIVDPAYQKRGIGTELLVKSEKYIASKGHDKIVIGAGKDYIMPGVPMNNGAHHFFEKNGYIHSWGDCGCFDMEQDFKNFRFSKNSIGDEIDGIRYRRAIIEDTSSVVKCMEDAQNDFIQYYQDGSLYIGSAKNFVLIAEKDSEVLGALIVCIESEGKDIGGIACVATMQKYRNHGIATTLVTLATKYMKDIGLSKAFVGYTYTYVANMYKRAGYEASKEYFMGQKMLK